MKSWNNECMQYYWWESGEEVEVVFSVGSWSLQLRPIRSFEGHAFTLEF